MDSSESADSKDVQEFALAITEQMMHMGNRMIGKKNANRYSPKIMKLALSVWQRSKSAYDHLKKSNVCMFPDVRVLARRKKELTLHQGLNPKIYSRLHDELVRISVGKVVGHIMVDEMQLKSGIYFHSKSHVVTGFATEEVE